MATNNALNLKDQGVTYYNGTSTFTGIDGSTSGFVLTSTGTGAAPTFQAPATSGTVTSVSGTANRITSTGGTTPVIDISASYVGQASITTLGTIASGVWQGTAVDATHGGTAQTSWTTGDLLYASGANTLAKLAAGSNTNVLTLAGGVPTWAAPATSGTVTSVSGTSNRITSTGGNTPVIDISSSYVGQSSITTLGTIGTGTWQGTVVGLPYGGTNANLTASNGGIFYSTATAGAILAGTATAGQVLQSGASTTPAWSTATYPATAGTSGNVLTSNGTNWTSAAPAGASEILVAKVTLTSAQIKAIRATPIQIIAAPGAGKVIVPVNAYYYFVYAGTNVFTNGQTITPRTMNGATYTGLYEWGFPGPTLVGTTNTILFSGVNPTGASNVSADMINKSVVMVNLGASEITGNAANDNTLEVALAYYIWTL